MNELIPVKSGKDYRIRTCRLRVLYFRYTDKAQVRAPTLKVIGYNKFKKLLKKERVHYEKTPFFCDHCRNIEGSAPMTMTLEQHVNAMTRQQPTYLRLKGLLAQGALPKDAAIIVQDFSQLNLESGFVQDLIICMYTYSPTSKDHIERHYYDVVGEKELKNGIAFVIHTYLKLFTLAEFQSLTHLYIWGDGGPHHFKISANMIFWALVQVILP